MQLLRLISGYIPVYGALVLAIAALAIFMDRMIKQDLKKSLLAKLYGSPRDQNAVGALRVVPLYYRILQELFGLSTKKSFVTRSALVTLLLLTILFLFQALVSYSDFSRITIPFLRQLLVPDGRFWIIIAGVVIVDLISIYQTITFLRISRGCHNVWEVLFVAAADFLLSISLFILIFPIFVTFAFFQSSKPEPIYILLSSRPTAQGGLVASEIASFLVFSSPTDAENKYLNNSETQPQIERKWFYRSYPVWIYGSSSPNPKIKDVLASGRVIGHVALQTRGEISDVQAHELIRKLIERASEVRKVETIESNDGFFSSHSLLYLAAEPQIEYKYFWLTYSSVLKAINFLDAQFIQIVTLHTPTVSQNTVMSAYNLAVAIPTLFDQTRVQYVSCDGKITQISKTRTHEVDEQFDKCERGIAVDSLAIKNLLSLTRYANVDSPSIPIAPLALSSLTATVIIYYLLTTRLLFRYVGIAIAKLTNDGSAVLLKHTFLISALLFMLVVFPIVLLLTSFFSHSVGVGPD